MPPEPESGGLIARRSVVGGSGDHLLGGHLLLGGLLLDLAAVQHLAAAFHLEPMHNGSLHVSTVPEFVLVNGPTRE
ncbi:hypothetical protein C0580_01890 [Candidatus Parcubacteria bacterium]|nr:MAG: hypothetical protein C0580_01890 [Candidatus Parcubacteria bacterium]